MATPFANALRQVLSAISGRTVLDYKTSFGELWNAGLTTDSAVISGQPINWSRPETTVLLVGTEPPAQEDLPEFLNSINFRDHLTALSWMAVCRLTRKTAGKVMVINHGGASILRPPISGLATLFGSRNVSGQETVPGTTFLNRPSLVEVLNCVDRLKHDDQRMADSTSSVLRSIMWEALRSSREGHHAISNVLGAFLLSPQVGDGLPDALWIQDCLFALVRACGIDSPFEQSGLKTKNDGQAKQAWIDERLRHDFPGAVLIDDMADIWKPFLTVALGFAKPSANMTNAAAGGGSITSRTFTALDSVAFKRLIRTLPLRLSRLVRTNRTSMTTSDLVPGSNEAVSSFVLFLDLRLFVSGDSKAAREFHKRVTVFGKRLLNHKGRHLPWLDPNSRAALEAELDGNAASGFANETLLPRLLSLLDPTLPIITFSSTHRTELIDPFRDYGNIITTFRKPILAGMTRDWTLMVKELHVDFVSAMEQAARVLRIRRDFQSMVSTRFSASHLGPRPPETQTTDVSAMVEIFIDESGTASEEKFALGAVVLISGQQVFNHRTYREAALSTAPNNVGLWGLDDVEIIRNLNQLPPRPWLSKGENVHTGNGATKHNDHLNSKLEAIEKLVRTQGGQLLVCSIISFEKPDPATVASARHPYHRYRHMLARLLEMILFRLAPVVRAIQNGARIGIDAATAKNDGTRWNLNDLSHDFGAELFSEHDKGKAVERCRTLAKSHVLPIVSGLLLRNAKENWANQIVRARAVQLTDFYHCNQHTLRNEARLDPKPLHYLADWIAHFTYDQRDWTHVPNIPVLKRWFTVGFRQQDDEDLRTALKCHRLWVQGAKVSAITEWRKINSSANSSGDFALAPRLARDAAQWTEIVSGDELRYLFVHSAEESPPTNSEAETGL